MPKNSGVDEGFRMAWNHVERGQETGMNKFWDVIAAVTLLGILPRRGKESDARVRYMRGMAKGCGLYHG